MDSRIPSIEECVRRWVEGMLRTPPIPCPRCVRRTRAEWRCQWCGAIWNDREMRFREELRRIIQ
jgi:tRNA(Ile2) C34 agmatinyltransferase TiaS